jgi:hypothetical protein
MHRKGKPCTQNDSGRGKIVPLCGGNGVVLGGSRHATPSAKGETDRKCASFLPFVHGFAETKHTVIPNEIKNKWPLCVLLFVFYIFDYHQSSASFN